MANNPFRGLGYVFKGFSLITRPGLRRFVLVPLLINVLLFGIGIWYGSEYFGVYMDKLLPDWLDWLNWLLVPLVGFALLVVAFFTFTMVANLISAPFNSLLAERVEVYLTGKNPGEELDQSWKKVLKDIVPTIRSELKKLGYFLIWSIPMLILFLVPVVQVAAPFLWLAFSAWFLALEYGDFPMGNHAMLFPQQKNFHRGQRLTSLGFGGGLMVMTSIPIINFLAVPVGVCGATAMWAGGKEHFETRKKSK
ncbi:MAG: sulfate transporter CysZ [Chromatiales bacterium]|nr:sulfate transporter CysZ [Chromatiales bacterium]